MAMRMFHTQLGYVRKDLLEMGSQVVQTIDSMNQSFQFNDKESMAEIIKNDAIINELEVDMHDKVTLLISKQQPVATDLRKLIVALKISSDLERVADLVVDIAKQSSRLNEGSLTEFKQKLLSMFKIAEEMIRESLIAYEQSDLFLAQRIAMMDDKVDRLYGEFIKELFNIKNDEIEVDQITQLAFIGRYIERIADYATNISEWVVYESNGKHFDLN